MCAGVWIPRCFLPDAPPAQFFYQTRPRPNFLPDAPPARGRGRGADMASGSYFRMPISREIAAMLATDSATNASNAAP
ncbi:MAG: hypothetical protein ACJAVR_000042 [Paracoccaceae bacterium]|jgi:hypothetical protein